MAGGQTTPRPPPRLPQSQRLVHLESCGSTNSEAMRLALASLRGAGEPLPLWVMADRQTAGRGRSGRQWQSLPGNLMASLALPLGCPQQTAAELSLVAGCAVVDAVRGACPGIAGLRLKWPNDVLVGGAKLGGILIESASTGTPGARFAPTPGRGALGVGSAEDGQVVVAVIGIGLNLAGHPAEVDRPAAHLFAHQSENKYELSPLGMLARIASAMHEWLCIWDEGRGLAEVRSGWLDRAGPLGEPLSVNAGARAVTGRFAGLDAGGALLLAMADGRVERFTFGDVTLAAT